MQKAASASEVLNTVEKSQEDAVEAAQSGAAQASAAAKEAERSDLSAKHASEAFETANEEATETTEVALNAAKVALATSNSHHKITKDLAAVDNAHDDAEEEKEKALTDQAYVTSFADKRTKESDKLAHIALTKRKAAEEAAQKEIVAIATSAKTGADAKASWKSSEAKSNAEHDAM